MTAAELHTQLRDLQAERALAETTGVAEIATLRGQLSGRLEG